MTKHDNDILKAIQTKQRFVVAHVPDTRNRDGWLATLNVLSDIYSGNTVNILKEFELFYAGLKWGMSTGIIREDAYIGVKEAMNWFEVMVADE